MNFEELSKINVNDKTEDKNGLTYLSWTWAWSEIKKTCPNATYEIKKFENDLPYVYDENTGYMVFTTMTINDITYEMWLPVMDGNNKAMLKEPYKYKVREYKDGKATGNYIEKSVEKATMFDINKTIMRCLVKNIAMFGLGIYIYAGEDYPDGYEMTKEEAEKVVVTFGKHKGKTLKDIKKEDANYLYWVLNSDIAKESLKQACNLLAENLSSEESKEKALLMNEVKTKSLITNTDLQAILDNYKVKEMQEMTITQLKEAVEVLRRKVERR